ncbi:MAG: hypothetical protein AAGJ46_20745 [Planctomycetota bacterium]
MLTVDVRHGGCARKPGRIAPPIFPARTGDPFDITTVYRSGEPIAQLTTSRTRDAAWLVDAVRQVCDHLNAKAAEQERKRRKGGEP